MVIPQLPRRENVGAEIVAVGNAHPHGHIETHGVLLEPHRTARSMSVVTMHM